MPDVVSQRNRRSRVKKVSPERLYWLCGSPWTSNLIEVNHGQAKRVCLFLLYIGRRTFYGEAKPLSDAPSNDISPQRRTSLLQVLLGPTVADPTFPLQSSLICLKGDVWQWVPFVTSWRRCSRRRTYARLKCGTKVGVICNVQRLIVKEDSADMTQNGSYPRWSLTRRIASGSMFH